MTCPLLLRTPGVDAVFGLQGEALVIAQDLEAVKPGGAKATTP